MKTVYFTPGPSALYPSVISHMKTGLRENIPSISHRSNYFQEIYRQTCTNLKKLLNIPEEFEIYFVASGTEAMERTIQNCVLLNSFHFVNGSFSKRFLTTALELNKKPLYAEVPLGKGFNFESINIPYNTELICVTHN